MKVYNVSIGVKKGMRKFFCSNCHMHQTWNATQQSGIRPVEMCNVCATL